MSADIRQQIARRVAADLPEGACVNLGIGLPTMVANHIPEGREIIFHSENGLLGVGPAPAKGEEDPDLINAGKMPVTLLPGASIFHHNDSFMMIRGGHIDYALLGASRWLPMAISPTGQPVRTPSRRQSAVRWTWRPVQAPCGS